MFLLVPAYPGCPGQTAVKWLLLLACFMQGERQAEQPGVFNISGGTVNDQPIISQPAGVSSAARDAARSSEWGDETPKG